MLGLITSVIRLILQNFPKSSLSTILFVKLDPLRNPSPKNDQVSSKKEHSFLLFTSEQFSLVDVITDSSMTFLKALFFAFSFAYSHA